MEVVSSGADQKGAFDPLYAHPGIFAFHKTQEALSEARFWIPGKLEPAKLRRSHRTFAEIEVLDPTLVPEDLANRIRIDALTAV
jgi:hypothetical protein